ncbi:nucleotide exchange factor GrpE [Prosthecochloris sp. ZM_2]|uniref:nucleotide exchange factor GrpE n=1 Tax=Prosthecochloris sp. ZM_2 TaxID=2045206 RepID=UPI000DF78946|nr:nucleotide exchange factor GrpE [Prosthecochloris sp. ZM_2]RNA64606.1 nucleotide exchange factor GrpE [Prosthecochloris sp. ZM_2]
MKKKASMHKEEQQQHVEQEELKGTKEPAIPSDEQPIEVTAEEVHREESCSRIAELEKELEAARQDAEKYRGEALRYAAEFENFRKRKEREASATVERVLENTIRELLPLVDDVHRILEHAPEVLEKSEEARPYVEGVQLLQKNLMKWLENKGVKKIEAKGKKMDVNYHEAITQMEHPEAESETVIEEYQTGYLLGDRVLRHAKVVVAR